MCELEALALDYATKSTFAGTAKNNFVFLYIEPWEAQEPLMPRHSETCHAEDTQQFSARVI